MLFDQADIGDATGREIVRLEVGTETETRTRWQTFVRVEGVLVRVEAWSRKAVAEAVRTLEPIP